MAEGIDHSKKGERTHSQHNPARAPAGAQGITEIHTAQGNEQDQPGGGVRVPGRQGTAISHYPFDQSWRQIETAVSPVTLAKAVKNETELEGFRHAP